MGRFTRRTFLKASAVGAGVGVLTGATTIEDVLAQTQSGCAIQNASWLRSGFSES
jgi:hypothetical protein